MSRRMFYAWQSDRDVKVGHYFIRDAADEAIKKINADAKIEEAPPFDVELDHDTKNVPGTPPIAEAIKQKIVACDVFLGDLTHVAKYRTADKRQKFAQNGNVLIELGMAMEAVGHDRIILVMNSAFGSFQGLPFDLQHHRKPISYDLPDANDKEQLNIARKRLADQIADALKLILLDLNAKEVAQRELKEDVQRAPKGSTHGQRWFEEEWQRFENQILKGSFRGIEAGRPLFAVAIIPARKLQKPIDLVAVEDQVTRGMQPLGSSGWNTDAYGRSIVTSNNRRARHDRAPEPPTCATELTDTGCIFAATDLLPGQWKEGGNPCVPMQRDERDWIRGIQRYIELLRNLGRKDTRYIVQMMLVRVANTYLLPDDYNRYDTREFRPLSSDVFEFETMLIDGVNVAEELRPAFNVMWREAGLRHDPCYKNE